MNTRMINTQKSWASCDISTDAIHTRFIHEQLLTFYWSIESPCTLWRVLGAAPFDAMTGSGRSFLA